MDFVINIAKRRIRTTSCNLQAISLQATEIASLLLFKRRRACGQGKLLIVTGSLLGELARVTDDYA